MKSNKHSLWLVLIILLNISRSFGQASVEQTVKTSSNSGDKSTAADPNSIYSVSLYTGTASATVPIYDYAVDGLDLGISLNYDTRGIKVDQTAENTGLGWSLYAGGYITRTVYGQEDEGYLPEIDSLDPQGNWRSKLLERRGNLVSSFADGANGVATVHDREFDVFEAHFGGRTVQFIIGTCYTDKNATTACPCATGLRQIVTFPKSELDIQYGGIVQRYAGDIDFTTDPYAENLAINFTIKDEKGNSFYFERGDYQKELIWAPSGNRSYYYYPTQKWDLKRVTTYTGQVINYSYNTLYNVSYMTYRDEQVDEVLAHTEKTGSDYPFYDNRIARKVDSASWWNGNLTTLSRIDYPNGTTVSFNYDANPRCDLPGTFALKSIGIKSGYDNQVSNTLTYKFNYAYFHSPISSNNNIELSYDQSCTALQQSFGFGSDIVSAQLHALKGLRLKLKSIDKIGTDNTTNERYYTFDYSTTPLPERLSPSKDLYGYYNGKSPVYFYSPTTMSNPPALGNSSIPLHTFTFTNGESFTYGVDKSDNFVYCQAFNLSKITNGLGGSIEFYYKAHVLSNPVNAYNNGNYLLPNNYDGTDVNDGLCIDKIVTKDGYNIDNTATTVYSFSGGQRFYQGGYFWDPIYFDAGSGSNIYDISSQYKVQSKTYYSSMISPRIYYSGSNHGYTYGTITHKGYNNTVLNTVKYTYTNLMDEHNPTVSNLSMRIYGCPTCAPQPRMLSNPYHPDYFYQYRMGLVLNESHYDMHGDLVSETNNSFADNSTIPFFYNNSRTIAQDGTSDMQSFNHDSYIPITSKKRLLQSSITRNYIDGITMETRMDYLYNDDDNVTSVKWVDSKGDNFEKIFIYSGQFVSETQLWKNDFMIKWVSMAANVIPFDMFYSLKTDHPLSHSELSGLNFILSGDKFFTLDDHKNVIETNFQEGKAFTAAIWDNRIGQKIAEVKNAHYKDIAYTGFEGTYLPKGTSDYNKGNWDFDPSSIIYDPSSSMTGHYYYSLNPSANNQIVSNNIPANNQDYLITFWCWGVAQVKLGNQLLSTTTLTSNVNGLWNLINVKVRGNGNDKITISSPVGSKIDELRLHPIDAAMSTTAYEPLFGPCTVINERNDIVRFEYDALGMRTTVRDIDKNIISYNQYVNQGADN